MIKKSVKILLVISILIITNIIYAADDAQIKAAIVANQNKLFTLQANHPVENIKATGDITLITFYDYDCPHSREFHHKLDDIFTETIPNTTDLKYKNIIDKVNKIIHVPVGLIDSDGSMESAIAALAAHRQDKFIPVDHALMHEGGVSTIAGSGETLISDIMQRPTLGFDLARFNQDYADVNLELQVVDNNNLLKNMSVPGVPLIIGAKLDSNNKILNDKVAYYFGDDKNGVLSMLMELTL
jgi:protein-disulfide isomerase